MKGLLTVLVLAAGLVLVASVGATGSPSTNDYTLEQAVQLSATGSAFGQAKTVEVSAAAARAAGQQPGFVSTGSPDVPAQVCWNNTGLWFSWGTWPYQQRVNENRYWCATGYGGSQTYRTSHVTLGGGGGSLCDHSGAYGFRTTGGNGYTWTTVRSGGHFACPTPIPWVTLHYDRWVEYACNTWGNCSRVDNSCTNCLLPSEGGGPVGARL